MLLNGSFNLLRLVGSYKYHAHCDDTAVLVSEASVAHCLCVPFVLFETLLLFCSFRGLDASFPSKQPNLAEWTPPSPNSGIKIKE